MQTSNILYDQGDRQTKCCLLKMYLFTHGVPKNGIFWETGMSSVKFRKVCSLDFDFDCLDSGPIVMLSEARKLLK